MTVLRSGSASDTGMVRSSNQDLALESSTLFAVADGMGGHAGGEVAARVAIDELVQAFSAEPTGQGLVEAISAANVAVWTKSQQNSELRGMGTTLTAAALVDEDGQDVLLLVNVGDSRAYRFHNGELSQITHDHSVAEEMFRAGEISAAEAAVHPHRHILTRALGVAPEVATDLWRLLPVTGDRYLLCSDGLTNEVGDTHLGQILGSQTGPQDAAEALIAAAKRNGGNDNITAVVLDVAIGEADAGTTAAAFAVTTIPPGGLVGGRRAASPSAAFALAGATSNGLSTEAAGPTRGPEPKLSRKDERASRRARSHPRSRRLFTFRAVVFTILLLAALAAAFAAVRWYDDNSYYVGVKSNELVIYQGRIGGFLWYHPREVDQTGVKTADIPQTYLPAVRAGVQESSLANARKYVANLRAAKRGDQPTTSTLPGQSTTSSTAPSSTTPGSSTTLVPAGGSI